MTGKVGRNDPCPCGSGRKYKKCCQESFDEKDFHYRRWRRVEADLIPELFAYVVQTLGPEAIEDAYFEVRFRLFWPEEIDEVPLELLGVKHRSIRYSLSSAASHKMLTCWSGCLKTVI
jgi:hypothetical protein